MDRWVRVSHFAAPLIVLLAACAPAQQASEPGSVAPQGSEEVADGAAISAEIRELLTAATQAWNRGELDEYLRIYTDDPSLTYIGPDGEMRRGKGAVRDRLQEAYFPATGEADDLSLDELEVKPTGPGLAVVTGRYTTYEPGFDSQPVTGQGWFSLVLRLEVGGWRVTHQHSS